MSNRSLRLGMVGGGEGAFIGAVHRMAAALDGDWTLVAGSFSSDRGRNERTGQSLGIDASRTYANFQEMMAAERALSPDRRIDAVAIVTPNHLHAPVAIAALESGLHVLCEKPLAMDVAEAEAIARAARASGCRFALAFTYSAYPLIEEARIRIARGDLGKIRLVQAEYLQGWLSRQADAEGNKQAEWRTDPARAGLGGCIVDIGVHAFQLAEHVSGLRVEAISADLTSHVASRVLDDDVSALLRFDNGARGVLKASQVAAGEENGLKLHIHGELGGLEWSQMEPNSLILRWLDRPMEILRTGGPTIDRRAAALSRTPAGHPEGYIEAFANLYRAFATAIREDRAGSISSDGYPGLVDGVRSLKFVEAAVANSANNEKWTTIEHLAT